MSYRLTADAEPAGSGSPTWWVIMSRELRDLWIGGKGLHVVLLYTILLGIYAFLLASNNEVNLLPLKEMILEMVKAAIAVCLLMGMMIAADTITSERERLTLEGLLLTPASRPQIVFGKFMAALSPIPIALVVTVPYLFVLSKGDPVFQAATLWLFVIGGLLVPALAALGLLATIWSNTTKSSMLVTLALYLLMLLPAEIIRPGKVMTASELKKSLIIQSLNPVDAINKFLGRILVLDAPPAENWSLLAMPALFGLFVLVLVFAVASPRLRLETTTWRRMRQLWQRLVPRKPSVALEART
jgi:ABC-type transport system involved in multi-copper enzyme maturation permease subunit